MRLGIFEHKQLINFSIYEGYMSDNKIELIFANDIITNHPKVLYHWTKPEKVDNILKEGLVISKGNWSIGSRGLVKYNAIFLVRKFGALKNNPGFKHYKKGTMSLLEVTIPHNITLYRDPHPFYEDIDSYVTFDNIPPEYVKIK